VTRSAARLPPQAPLISYDWNMLPLGQALWLNELESYNEFPPLQAPEAYSLDGIIAEMKASKTASHALVV
jgi:hypothetical protein